jgi:hypothetical protein
MSSAPPGPDAAVRQRRGAALVVALVLVAGVVATGAVLVARAVTGTPFPGTSGSAAQPLLPGAPEPTAQPREPAATVDGVGFDISYPQCLSALPSGGSFGIVGVNGGAPRTSNRCLSEQAAWARGRAGYAVYVNTSYTGRGDPVEYGRALIDDAVARKQSVVSGGTSMWWLDVEITNTWRGTQQENATVLAAMASRLQELGVRVGIYSSPQQFQTIAGDWAPGLPVWNATGPGRQAAAMKACSESFAGSSTAIVQWVQRADGRQLDHNVICPDWSDRAGDLLDLSSG